MSISAPRPLLKADDLGDFDCGLLSLNQWLHRNAWRNHVTGDSRVNVICDETDGFVVGFVALAATKIERAELLKPQQRNRPAGIPMVLLGQLAITKKFQGQGLASGLMLFAIKSVQQAAELIGCHGLVTQPINDDVRAFYRNFDFDGLPQDPKRAMILRIADIKTNQ
jgi:ribosomal protein S18 acetylase RimI-like enzyme